MATDATAPQQPQTLASLCSSLQTSSSATNERLRNFIVAIPESRDEISSLSRELVELQKVSRLLVRHALSVSTTTNDNDQLLPDTVLDPLKDMFVKISGLLAESLEVVNQLDAFAGSVRDHPDLPILMSRLAAFAKLAEVSRLASNVAVDAMNFSPNADTSITSTDLPSYQSTQLLQDSVTVRMRIQGGLRDSDQVFPVLSPTVINFLDSLQHHIEQTTGTLLVPPPPDNADARSDASSVQSEYMARSGQITPAYDPIVVNNPAPSSITIRHKAKKDISTNEIYSTHFINRNQRSIICLSTQESPTRFLDASSFHLTLNREYGYDLAFCDQNSYWAYSVDDSRLPGGSHNGTASNKSYIVIGDYTTNARYRMLRGPGSRALCFNPEGNILAITDARCRLGIVDTTRAPGQHINTIITSHTEPITHAIFAPDSTAIITLSEDGLIRVTDPYTREPIAKLDTGSTKKPLFLGISPDGEVVVSIWGDYVFRWNYITSAVESYSLPSRRSKEGVPIALSPDCRFIACQTHYGVDVGDAHNGTILFTIHFQAGFVTSAAFSATGNYLALSKAVASSGLRTTKSTLDIWELVF